MQRSKSEPTIPEPAPTELVANGNQAELSTTTKNVHSLTVHAGDMRTNKTVSAKMLGASPSTEKTEPTRDMNENLVRERLVAKSDHQRAAPQRYVDDDVDSLTEALETSDLETETKEPDQSR